MYRLVLIAFVFLGFNAKAAANDTIPFAKIDSITYSFYMNGDWSRLKSEGEKLISYKIDWYYLRLRMTEAELQLNHPGLALKHIIKAEKFSGVNVITNNYSIRSYLLLGRYSHALFVSAIDTSSSYYHLLSKNKSLKVVELEGILKFNRNANQGLFSGYRAGLTTYLGRRYSFYLSIQHYSQSNWVDDSLNRESMLHLGQSQFYSKINILFSHQYSILLGGQLSATRIGNSVSDNYLVFGGVEVFRPSMKYKFSLSSTNFNGTKKVISAFSVTSYPFLNTSFYHWFNFTNIYDADSAVNNLIVDFGMGGKISKNLWADIFMTPMAYDFHTLNDYEVTFNLQDKVDFKIGGGVSYFGWGNRGIKINFITEFMQVAGITQHKKYNQNTITLCLNWYR